MTSLRLDFILYYNWVLHKSSLVKMFVFIAAKPIASFLYMFMWKTDEQSLKMEW